ncbi:MAG: hypothetical protein ACYCYL_07395 [Acidithiobacillus sp.]
MSPLTLFGVIAVTLMMIFMPWRRAPFGGLWHFSYRASERLFMDSWPVPGLLAWSSLSGACWRCANGICFMLRKKTLRAERNNENLAVY